MRGPRRAAVQGLLILVLPISACGDRQADGSGEEPRVRAGEAPAPDVVETRVFMREPDPEAGAGRLVLHFIVPGDASPEQIRQALVRTMEDAAEADSTVVALRAVAYTVAPPTPGRAEADLVPLAWGEWLPPGGWTGPATRTEVHRFHTYQGVQPEW